MKTRISLLLSALCLTLTFTRAQDVAAGRNKAIYLEGLGSGLLLSANYDFRFKPTQDGAGMRIGVGGGSFDATVTSGGTTSAGTLGVVTLPVLVNYLAGKGRFAFEGGAGVTPIYISASSGSTVNNDFVRNTGFGVFGTLNVGVRAQPIRNGVVFRLNWTPVISDAGFQPQWAGISLGYGFK